MTDLELMRLQAEIRRVSVSVLAGVITLGVMIWVGILFGWA
jgi:hypothetical protein